MASSLFIKKLIIKLFIPITGNYFTQTILKKMVNMFQFLMGIGSGSSTTSSGEKSIFKLLLKEDNLCIFDVGANKGQFADLTLSELKNKKISLHCFEPGNFTFEELKKNVPTQSNIKVNNLALGRSEEEKTLYYNEAGSGLASMTKRNLDHFGIDFEKSEKIKVTTIDKYCEENSINKIDLLKIDVEGHELDVLAGARRMFEKNLIKIVTFEFGGCNIDTRTFFRDFYIFFKNQDMDIFIITPTGYLFPIKKYKEIDEQFRTTNFVAIKK